MSKLKAVPSILHTTKTKGGEDQIAVDQLRKWTKFADLGGMSLTGFKTLAILIERSQIADRLACGVNRWDMYPRNRFAWLAIAEKTARFIGVGHEVENIALRTGEDLFKIKLPWDGCGRDLAERVGIYKLHSELTEKHGRNKGAVLKEFALKAS